MVFLTMFVSVGMAIDFMRHETYRAELQDAVDRGILAAAAFNQTADAETTIRGYLKSARFANDDYDLEIPTNESTTGTRRIEATVNYDVKTFFLKIIGINSLPIVASGTALEGASKLEISLVLDVSTSMVIFNSADTGKTRLSVLQDSAKDFLDLVFSEQNNDRMSMSLIPFAGQVNVGQTAFDYFNNNSVHSYSHCLELGSSDFFYVPNIDGAESADPYNTMVTMPATESLAQMQHFNFSKYYNSATGSYDLYGPEGVDNVDWGWCPTDAQAILYHETNKDLLKARIDNLRTHEGTGTHYGAKWGAVLLDPSSQALTDEVDGTNESVTDASGVLQSTEPVDDVTPAPYGGEEDVKKFLIIMSDGDTTSQQRVRNRFYNETHEYEYWASNLSSNQSSHFRSVGTDGSRIRSGPTKDGGWTEDSTEASREAARIAFSDVCETAKDNGIIVFTIGFDLADDSNAKTDLAECATTGFYYEVEGEQLEDAFAAIAATIQKLRLIM